MAAYHLTLVWLMRFFAVAMVGLSVPTVVSIVSGEQFGRELATVAFAVINLWVAPVMLLSLGEIILLLRANNNGHAR